MTIRIQTLSLKTAIALVRDARVGETICILAANRRVLARSMSPDAVRVAAVDGKTMTFTVTAGRDVEGPWHKVRG